MKLLTHLHRGFTLIEMMIVVAIIGILVPVFYPQAIGYIERAHDLELRMAYKELLKVIDQHIMDKGGELASSTGQMNNIWEYYYIAYQDMSGPAILGSGWERYDTLSQYVQSSPEAQSAIRKLETLNPFDIDRVSHAIRFWKTTPSELSSLYGALFVGLPTGNNKFTAYNWGIIIDISPYAGSASSTDGDYFDAYSWNGIDYPAGYNKYYQIPGDDVQLNKACFPGRGDSYYTDTNGFNFVGCTYFFGQ